MNITVDEIKQKGVRVDRGSLNQRFNLDEFCDQILKDIVDSFYKKYITNAIELCLNLKNVEDTNWVSFKTVWYYYTKEALYFTREVAYNEKIKNVVFFLNTNPTPEDIWSEYNRSIRDSNLKNYELNLLGMKKENINLIFIFIIS